MMDIERARNYIRIFIAVGDRWEDFAPLDGERTPDGLRIGSVEIGPHRERSDVWFLKDGETVKWYARAVFPPDPPAGSAGVQLPVGDSFVRVDNAADGGES